MSDEIRPPSGSEETPQAPKNETPQDGLDDLRASMAEEEQARQRAKKTGILKKMTGLLRRQTSELAAQPDKADARAPQPAAPGPFTGPLANPAAPGDEMSEAAFAEKIGDGFSGWPEQITPDPLETKPLFWDESGDIAIETPGQAGAEAAPAAPAGPQPAFIVEDIEPTPAFSDDIDGDEATLTPQASAAFEMPPAGGAFKDGDWTGEGAGEPGDEVSSAPQTGASTWQVDEIETTENAETESLRAELMPEASPGPTGAARPPIKRGLRRILTGWLNPDEVQEEAPQDVADELLEDRLQRIHSDEYPPEIPGAHRAVGAFDEPLEDAAPQDEGESGELSLWKPLVERGVEPENPEGGEQPSGIRYESPAGRGQESRLPRNWVDSRAGYLEEPLAEDLNDNPAPGDQPVSRAPSLLAEAAAQAGESEVAAPGIETVRSQALEDYVEPDYVPIPAQEPFAQRARAWMRRNLAVLIALAVVLIVASTLAATRPWTRAPIARPNTPVPSGQPYPVGLELTGGWFFDVNRSTIVSGVWQPQGAEWLDNSQVRRVVALPWNDQSQAVVQTLKRGDQINLVFNNNDLMPFLVKSVERLEKGDTALFSENSPGLVIFLYGEESEQRWVVLALPK